MQIHNILSQVQRERAADALNAVGMNLASCTSLPGSFEDRQLFALDDGEPGVDTLRIWLRDHEMRIFVAIRRHGMLRRMTFVEHLRSDDPSGRSKASEAVARLPDWGRYVAAAPSAEALLGMEEKRSVVVRAAVGAASRIDERWRTLWIKPAFGKKSPLILLGNPSGQTSAYRARDSDGGGEAIGRMSDELARELSVMSDLMFVATSKPISNPGFQIDFGPLPGIRIINDQSSIDLMRSMRHRNLCCGGSSSTRPTHGGSPRSSTCRPAAPYSSP